MHMIRKYSAKPQGLAAFFRIVTTKESSFPARNNSTEEPLSTIGKIYKTFLIERALTVDWKFKEVDDMYKNLFLKKRISDSSFDTPAAEIKLANRVLKRIPIVK